MICIISEFADPYYNIAAEEYLLKNFTDDILLLYYNEPSVIIGKHQNTLAEINYKHITENNIKVVRRISGGGTVFHDFGNLNFCFICNGSEGHLVDFKKFTQPVIDVLIDLKVNAKLEGKNDIRVEGLKVSGNAEHVFKKRVLHHGTLLFSSDLKKLSEALHVEGNKYTDKAVKSIRSNVANISSYINLPIHVNQFRDLIIAQVYASNETQMYSLTKTDCINIEELIKQKYSTWEWNYGYSPAYTFSNSAQTNDYMLSIKFEVNNGIIVNSELSINKEVQDYASKIFVDKKHSISDITEILMQIKMSNENTFRMDENLKWLFF
jgi:lipoate-protein ligase A